MLRPCTSGRRWDPLAAAYKVLAHFQNISQKKYLLPDKVNSLRSMNLIEICPLEYMRGRNFHNSFMILDEAQNCTREQIKMFMTRIGWDSKAVINGDIDQSDLPMSLRGGLAECLDKLEDVEGVGICKLTSDDIIRNDVIARILSKLSND